MQVFRNSIGALTPPTYKFWVDDRLNWTRMLMIGNVWFWFAFNVFLMYVIMMNILIGIVSQTYDEVKDSHVVQWYESKCVIIDEAAAIFDSLNIKLLRGNCIIVKGRVQSTEISHEYLGFVRTIKNATKYEISKV